MTSRSQLFTVLIVSITVHLAYGQKWFNCPQRCQCYEDPEDPTHSIHLICKWEQLNLTNLLTLLRPEYVRTLTIRCPHNNKVKSRPPAGLFTGLRNLDRLEIDRCLIESVPPELFSGLHQLYSLIIKNARIPDIPNDLFSHLPNLMTLDLTGNDLKIEPYALRTLTNLIHLDLSNNSIAFLANTMISLTKLKVLTMDHNRLTNIDFRRLPEELTDLSLRHNFISTLHTVAQSAKHLRRLDLAHNNLDFISGSGTVNVLPTRLKTLDLSNNRIAFVQDGAMEKLGELILVDLKNNSISELRESALVGPKQRLRLMTSSNPFVCGCSLRWMIQPTTQLSAQILDLDDIQCSHLLNPDLLMNLTTAEKKNELICKYENLCPDDCFCCRSSVCECRLDCPVGCQCFRSSKMLDEKTAQNIVICEGLRIDKLDEVPDTVTELRLTGDWREWAPEKLGRLEQLRTLNLSNTHLTEITAKNISPFPRLYAVDLSSNGFTEFPKDLGGINQLYMGNNPLREFTSKDLTYFDVFKKVAFGGNQTSFECECETPSALQRWLRTKKNREKVKDVDEVYCNLPLHGKVKVIDTLPGNESICNDETKEVSNWVKMVDNIEQHKATTVKMKQSEATEANEATTFVVMMSTTTERTSRATTVHWSTARKRVLPTDGIYEKAQELETNTYSTPEHSTTRKPRRRGREEPESNRFINVLIIILFIAVLFLLIAIAFTVYYRFFHTDVMISSQKKTPSQESRPLNA